MRRIGTLLLALCLLLGSCAPVQRGDPVSPEEIEEYEERARYLYRDDIYLEPWWGVGAFADGFGDNESVVDSSRERTLRIAIPELNINDAGYHPFSLFQSYEELKQATEQYYTKEYMEQYLLPWAEDSRMFLEYEGELYISDLWPNFFHFPPEKVTFQRKEGDVVYLDAHFTWPDGSTSTEETQLKLEDGLWKFQRSHMTGLFEAMLA